MEAIYVCAYLLLSGFTTCVITSVLLSFRRYNKRDFDFPSLREYNDYLEQVEDMGRRVLLKFKSCLLV